MDETFSDPQFTSPADQQQCASAGVTDPATLIKGASGAERFPAGGLPLPTNDWESLSSDPQTLLTQVHQRDGGPDTPAEWFTNVADLMRESDVPPVIRAALYQATALIPGVRVLGPQTTHDGQTGLGVAFYVDGAPTHALIFDRTTARLLGEVYYDRSGAVTEWADYLQQRVVNSVPDYPTVAGVTNPDSSGQPPTDQPTDTSQQTTSTTTTTAAAGTPSTPTLSTPTTGN